MVPVAGSRRSGARGGTGLEKKDASTWRLSACLHESLRVATKQFDLQLAQAAMSRERLSVGLNRRATDTSRRRRSMLRIDLHLPLNDLEGAVARVSLTGS